MNGRKIIDGLKDAVAGRIARVHVGGHTYVRADSITAYDVAAVAYKNFYGRPWSEASEQARQELLEIAGAALQGERI